MGYYYADAINNLGDGQAAKRPRWRGYIKKINVQEDGSYDLVYVKKDGTQATYHVDAEGIMSCDSPLTLNASLNSDMLSNDWIIGSAEEFESSRSGEGEGEF